MRARMLPAGQAPDLPNWRRTAVGHTRDGDLLGPGRRPETPSRGRAGLRHHRGTDASAATPAFSRTGVPPWQYWEGLVLRVGTSTRVPPVLATVRFSSAMNIPGARSPTLRPNCFCQAR